MQDAQSNFAAEFERVLRESDTSVRRLARLSGVSRRTLENWRYGQTSRPRHVEPILQIARALDLSAAQTDRLLAAAGHPTLDRLRTRGWTCIEELLGSWRLPPNTLHGQRSAALGVRHNLPAATTPFLGRKTMGEEVAGLLRKRELRLVTIGGLGGVGKTRLALETAHTLRSRYDHGVYFVPLDNIFDAPGFWAAIRDGLDIPAGGAAAVQGLVLDYLENKQILLLLDNFEHLLPLASEISLLLARTSRLTLLVTSRRALDLQAEQLYLLEGLSCTAGTESPAYALFLQTARRRLPGYEPTPENAADILALCRAVSGLPLALELAGTWIDLLSPRQILDRLQSDLRAVGHNGADRPPRQRSLWHLFDYSWQMLSAAEQKAAQHLSVLHGTFTTPMAMAIAGCTAADLKRLLQSAFVRQSTGTRLMIHPLVRQFLMETAAEERLDRESLEETFMDEVLHWASRESGLLRETLKSVHYRNLHAEWQHIERAWWLAAARGRSDLLESCWDLIVYFEVRATYLQGRALFEATRLQFPAEERRLQARIDEALAVFAARLLELPRSFQLAKRALQTYEDLGIDLEQDTAGKYAQVVLITGEYALNQAQASPRLKRALREVTQGYLATFSSLTLTMLDGVAASSEGNHGAALQAFEQARALSGQDAFTYPILCCFMGIMLRHLGREAQAHEQFASGLERGLALDIYPAVVAATYELRLLAGDDPTTEQCRAALERLALEMGSRRTVGHVAKAAAIQYLNLGDTACARQMTRIGVGMLWEEVNTAERAHLLSTVAQAYIAAGLIKKAPQLVSLLGPKMEQA